MRLFRPEVPERHKVFNNVADSDALIARACRGDSLAIQQLMLAEYDRLAARIRRKLGSHNHIAVEDVIQDTFFRAIGQIEHFKPQGPDAFYRWLATIAERRLTDLFRAAGRRKRERQARPAGD